MILHGGFSCPKNIIRQIKKNSLINQLNFLPNVLHASQVLVLMLLGMVGLKLRGVVDYCLLHQGHWDRRRQEGVL